MTTQHREDATRAQGVDNDISAQHLAATRRAAHRRRIALAAIAILAVGAGALLTARLPVARAPQVAPAQSAPATVVTTTTGAADSEALAATNKKITKYVTRLGDPTRLGRTSYFVSPTGNVWCKLSAKGASCRSIWYAARAKLRSCGKEGNRRDGAASVGTKGRARWGCSTAMFGYPFLKADKRVLRFLKGELNPKGVAWYDARVGTAVRAASFGPKATLAALRYGNTLVAGRFRCTMATTGVTCINTKTHHGFHVNRLGAQLH